MVENIYTFNKKPTNSYANKKNPFRCNNPFEIKTASYFMFINILVNMSNYNSEKAPRKKYV